MISQDNYQINLKAFLLTAFNDSILLMVVDRFVGLWFFVRDSKAVHVILRNFPFLVLYERVVLRMGSSKPVCGTCRTKVHLNLF